METKICRKCGEEKELAFFSKDKNCSDGRKPYCKQCVSLQSAEYREKYRDEINRRKRISYEKSKSRKAERTAAALAQVVKICAECGAEKPVSEFYEKGNGGLSSRCKSCEANAQKRFREENKERIRERKRGYNARNKSKIDEYNRRYAREHSAENVARVQRWAQEHPERAKELAIASEQRRRARKAATESSFTKTDWEMCKAYFTAPGGLRCAYCGKLVSRPTQDHVVSLADGGGYTRNNIIPACRSCNSSKCDKEIWTWFRNQDFYSPEREKKIRDYLKSTAEN